LCLAAYCRIRLQKTGEEQLSSDIPERLGDEELPQVSLTPVTVLSVRFISRRYRQDASDSGKDDDETDPHQGPDNTASSDSVSESDAAAAAADDDDDCTPGQVDWIVVTSHADNTIRFRNAEVNHYTIFCEYSTL